MLNEIPRACVEKSEEWYRRLDLGEEVTVDFTSGVRRRLYLPARYERRYFSLRLLAFARKDIYRPAPLTRLLIKGVPVRVRAVRTNIAAALNIPEQIGIVGLTLLPREEESPWL